MITRLKISNLNKDVRNLFGLKKEIDAITEILLDWIKENKAIKGKIS